MRESFDEGPGYGLRVSVKATNDEIGHFSLANIVTVRAVLSAMSGIDDVQVIDDRTTLRWVDADGETACELRHRRDGMLTITRGSKRVIARSLLTVLDRYYDEGAWKLVV